MSKFIDIIESATPVLQDNGRESKIDHIINKMVDRLSELLNNIEDIEVISTDVPEELQVRVNDITLTLRVTDVTEGIDEDNETYNYELDRGVEALAAKANSGLSGFAGKIFGTKYQQAKAAVRERQNVASKGIDVYRRVTKKLEDAIAASDKDTKTTFNVI